jgi:hypothetical protein
VADNLASFVVAAQNADVVAHPPMLLGATFWTASAARSRHWTEKLNPPRNRTTATMLPSAGTQGPWRLGQEWELQQRFP